jgi:hypothetical protein
LDGKGLFLQLSVDRHAGDGGEPAEEQEPDPPSLAPGESAEIGGQASERQTVPVARNGQEPPDQALAAGVDVILEGRLVTRLRGIGDLDVGRFAGLTFHGLAPASPRALSGVGNVADQRVARTVAVYLNGSVGVQWSIEVPLL